MTSLFTPTTADAIEYLGRLRMNSIGIELTIVAGLILLNGIFAMSEMAMVAAKKRRLKTRADAGDKAAIAAYELAIHPEKFLSTVQIGITLIGILAGAFAGATVSKQLAASFRDVPLLAGREDFLAIAIVVAGITFFTLIFGELVPKQIALKSPEAVACLVARPMSVLSTISKPLVWLLSVSSVGVLKLFKLKSVDAEQLTEEDLHVVLKEVSEHGIVHPTEGAILERAATLEDVKVRDIMTQRHDIVWMDTESTPEENLARIQNEPHSHYPVRTRSTEEIHGSVATRALLVGGYGHKSHDLARFVEPLLYVPESINLVRLLALLKEQRSSRFMVLDEHGGVEGWATLNDITEALLGDMPGVNDPSDWFLDKGDDTYYIDGGMPLTELGERLDIDLTEAKEESEASTIGGWLIYTSAGQYQVGYTAKLGPLSVEIADLDGHRIDKVRATLTAESESDSHPEKP